MLVLGFLLAWGRAATAQQVQPEPGRLPSPNPLCDGAAVSCLDIDDLAAHAYAHLQVLPRTDQRDIAVVLPLGAALGLFGRVSGGVSTHFTFGTGSDGGFQQFGPLRLSLTLRLWPLLPLWSSGGTTETTQTGPTHYSPPRGLQLGLAYEHEVRVWKFDGANSLGLLTDLAALRVLDVHSIGTQYYREHGHLWICAAPRTEEQRDRYFLALAELPQKMHNQTTPLGRIARALDPRAVKKAQTIDKLPEQVVDTADGVASGRITARTIVGAIEVKARDIAEHATIDAAKGWIKRKFDDARAWIGKPAIEQGEDLAGEFGDALIPHPATVGAVIVTGGLGRAGEVLKAADKLEEVAQVSKKASHLAKAVRKAEHTQEAITKIEIHAGKQGKHIPGHNNFISGRSELTHPAPQSLLDKHAGTGVKHGNKEVVDFGENIGTAVSEEGVRAPTTRGRIHYSADGKSAHIVPAKPKP